MVSPQGDVRVALPPQAPMFEGNSAILLSLHTQHPQSQPSTSSSTFTCPYPECLKTFSRKAKLSEHINTHTGDRPFVCAHDGCGASYRSSSKLRAHERSHLSTADQERTKSFACTQCDKKFWTRQHLNRHFEGVHGDGVPMDTNTKEYKCSEPGCEATFSKRKKLREHIWASHTDKGDDSTPAQLPFSCGQPDCNKRFPTNSKRKTHFKTAHTDEARYTCALDHGDTTQVLAFSTWSALQTHMREAHPPTCPYPACNGKTFKNRENLKLHIRRHEEKEREAEADVTSEGYHLGTDVDQEDGHEDDWKSSSTTRSFACDWQPGAGPACTKVFKSLHAMKTHVRVAHLKERPFGCACGKTYGHRHLLKRHEVKCTQAQRAQVGPDDDEDAVFRQNGGALPDTLRSVGSKRKRDQDEGNESTSQRLWDRTGTSMLDLLTGSSYAAPTQAPTRKRQMRGRVVSCPWPKLQPLLPGKEGDESAYCQHAFSRVYDVRRHLRATHHIDLDDKEVRALLDRDEVARLATPRGNSA